MSKPPNLQELMARGEKLRTEVRRLIRNLCLEEARLVRLGYDNRTADRRSHGTVALRSPGGLKFNLRNVDRAFARLAGVVADPDLIVVQIETGISGFVLRR
jgi:hypothetical protein